MYAAGFEEKLDLMVLSMSGTDLDVLLNVRLEKLPNIEVSTNYLNGCMTGCPTIDSLLDGNLCEFDMLSFSKEHFVNSFICVYTRVMPTIQRFFVHGL